MVFCFGSIFHTNQCVKVPLGESGSSTITASVLAVAGTSCGSSGGLIFAPSQVYLDGMLPPFVKAGLVIVIFDDSCPVAVIAIKVGTTRRIARPIFIWLHEISLHRQFPSNRVLSANA